MKKPPTAQRLVADMAAQVGQLVLRAAASARRVSILQGATQEAADCLAIETAYEIQQSLQEVVIQAEGYETVAAIQAGHRGPQGGPAADAATQALERKKAALGPPPVVLQ